MKRTFILVILFFVATVMYGQNFGTPYDSAEVSLKLRQQDTLDMAIEKASNDVPYLKWFVGSLFLPGATIVASEVIPVDTVKGYTKIYNDAYKKAFRRERTQATIYGGILGGLMLVWWGLIIL